MPSENAPLDRLMELVSPKVGVIRSLAPVVRGAEEPDLPFIYQATLSHFDFRNAKSWERGAIGKGLSEKEAIRGAIGEAIEHYCAAHFDTTKTRQASWAAMQSRAVAGRSICTCGPGLPKPRPWPTRRLILPSDLQWSSYRIRSAIGDVAWSL